MKDTYIFPAVFEFCDNGIAITFPDLSGCLPCAESTEKAVQNAKEALTLHLYGMEEDGEPIPDPTPFDKIPLQEHQTLVLIEIYMPPFREKQHQKFVKKTLSIPSWMNAQAEHAGINFSKTLQEALLEKLHLN
ncbi:MAG: type II toxin-antitoxin system HicB family antitoxin [Oscillospiraceae bacterium]